jgi:hypothetical protein
VLVRGRAVQQLLTITGLTETFEIVAETPAELRAAPQPVAVPD